MKHVEEVQNKLHVFVKYGKTVMFQLIELKELFAMVLT